MTIGEKIRSIRKLKGFTQKRLGELCRIDEANIRKYELGHQNPKLETIKKIAKALDVPLTNLISPEVIEVRKEDAALEALKTILEYIYDDVDFDQHKSVDRDGCAEGDGNYDVFLKKGQEEITLTKQSYEALFEFVRTNIPNYIKIIVSHDK